MFYMIAAMAVLLLFLLIEREKRQNLRELIGMIAMMIISLLFISLYLSKDLLYYSTLDSVFRLPPWIWKNMLFYRISRGNILRIINAAVLLGYYLDYVFSVRFCNVRSREELRRTEKNAALFLAFEWFFYDPLIEKLQYRFWYPYIMSVKQYEMYLTLTGLVTTLINLSLVLVSLRNMLKTLKKSNYFPYLHGIILSEAAIFFFVLSMQVIFLWRLPEHLVRYSKISGYTKFLSIRLHGNMFIYHLFPAAFFLIAALIVCVLVFSETLRKRISRRDFRCSIKIDAANTTSKTFCHYMKNELLSLRARMELMDESTYRRDKGEVITSLDNLYMRLEEIHRNTKEAVLTLRNEDLEEIVRELLKEMKPEQHGCRTDIVVNDALPLVLVDPEYIKQALRNIIEDDMEVLQRVKEERRYIRFTLRTAFPWVALSITDEGPGISEKNIDHIFEPFFSSSPITQKWGIGLTMTYRIVEAHHGKISVESTEGEGTTFRILLPTSQNVPV